MAKRKSLDVRTLRWARLLIAKRAGEYGAVGLTERVIACSSLWVALHQAEKKQDRALKPAKRTKR